MIANHRENISIWVGEKSQNSAFPFYNLQAEQFFDEEEDPVDHHVFWNDIKNRNPRGIIFNTQIERLAAVREVNHKKLLKKMQKAEVSMFDQYYFPVDMKAVKEKDEGEEEEEGKWDLFDNWRDTEDNYQLIDLNFNCGKQTENYEAWKDYYNIRKQNYENKFRHELQKTDYLRSFTICSDDQLSGFTHSILQYLRDECPKKQYIFSSLGGFSLPSLTDIYPEVDVYIPFSSAPQFPYFKNASQWASMAPLFNCLYTPLMLKEVNPHHYIQNIVMGNKKLFNVGYCLPIIDSHLQLSPHTNIFEYPLQALQPEKQLQNRINFANKGIFMPTKQKKFISQSYILKGTFNKFEALFAPKTQSLSIKYLPGILSAPSLPSLTYDPFYHDEYGEIVQAYPFHCVMFTHESFGDDLRDQVRKVKKSKIFNEMESQWRAKMFEIADYFSEQVVESD